MQRPTLMTGCSRGSAAALVAALAIALAATPAAAQQGSANEDPNQAYEDVPPPAPHELEEDTWISLGGVVTEVGRDRFEIDYGDGTIIVEMDDGDRDADGYQLKVGDRVSVVGQIDDAFAETTTIEAAGVYVEKIHTFFRVKPHDAEREAVARFEPVIVPESLLQGIVTSVGPQQFTVARKGRRITVDVSQLDHDPLDDEGYQRVEIGDRVSVSGDMSFDILDGYMFVATSVVEISD